MAKVVLVWNEHPTEVVAGFHARKVAEILREKYGHEVIVEKMPRQKTVYGALLESPSDAVKALVAVDKQTLDFIAQVKEKHGADVFNFHTSEAKNSRRG